MRRRTSILLGASLGLGAAVLFVFGANLRSGATALNGALIEPPLPAEDFTLTSVAGPVRLSDFLGRTVVLFFGYTHCPDVCPLTMSRVAQALKALESDADRVQAIMVSIDPERDSPGRMAEYVQSFNPGFLGLSGSAEEVSRVAASYGIFYARAAASGESDDYLVDHTATVTVISPEGSIQMLWPTDLRSEEMASDLRYLLRR
jgi:protein SCO1/2